MTLLQSLAALLLFLAILATIISIISRLAALLWKPRDNAADQIPDRDACWSGWEIDEERAAELEYLAGREPMGRTPDGLRGEG